MSAVLTSPLFLDDAELRALTGFAYKTKQVEQLRRMGVPFRINGAGRPVVARSAIDGSAAPAPKQRAAWTPKVISGG